MPTLSMSWNPNDPPSAQVRGLLDMWRGNDPIDKDALENSIKMTIDAVCFLIDSEYCQTSILKTLAHHLRCKPAYLIRIQEEHRRTVLGITDARAAKIAKERHEASKAHAKQTSEGRMRETRVKSEGPGWGLPFDDIQTH